jgi:hypothetical protein
MDSLKEEKNGFGINNNSNLKNGGEEKNQDDDIFEGMKNLLLPNRPR